MSLGYSSAARVGRAHLQSRRVSQQKRLDQAVDRLDRIIVFIDQEQPPPDIRHLVFNVPRVFQQYAQSGKEPPSHDADDGRQILVVSHFETETLPKSSARPPAANSRSMAGPAAPPGPFGSLPARAISIRCRRNQ